MSKGTFFTGQPIFNQVLNFIPRSIVNTAAKDCQADRYCKYFKTYEHLVTMLYSIFNQCNSLREVTTGLLAWDKRILHLGIDSHPRRSTISDANERRTHEVFEKIYFKLLNRYEAFLPDSRKRSRKDNLYIFDATSIALFQEVLKGSGLSKANGKRKGGIKVHTLLNARHDAPCMIRYSAGADNDARFLKDVQLPSGSVIVFDKGYRDYSTYNRFTSQKITWVTRHRDHSVYRIKKRCPINDHQRRQGVKTDWIIELGHNHSEKATKVQARMVRYCDPMTNKYFQFITNNEHLAPFTIANYYKQYFLGDNENAIKIQIWCSLIADLLLKVIKRGTRSTMAFSNIVALIRLHLMTYMNLKDFLQSPEKALLKKIRQQVETYHNPSLFSP